MYVCIGICTHLPIQQLYPKLIPSEGGARTSINTNCKLPSGSAARQDWFQHSIPNVLPQSWSWGRPTRHSSIDRTFKSVHQHSIILQERKQRTILCPTETVARIYSRHIVITPAGNLARTLGLTPLLLQKCHSLFFVMTLSDEELGFLSQQNDNTFSSINYLQQRKGVGSEVTRSSDGAQYSSHCFVNTLVDKKDKSVIKAEFQLL